MNLPCLLAGASRNGAPIINLVVLGFVFIQSTCIFSASSSELSNTYTVTINLRSGSCVQCVRGLLGSRLEQWGIAGRRTKIVVVAEKRSVRKEVESIVMDSTLISVTDAGASDLGFDRAVVTSSKEPIRREFALPSQYTQILPYIDSVDAKHTTITIDSAVFVDSVALKTKMAFNSNVIVRVLGDGRTVAVSLADRALCLSSNACKIMPSYTSALPDSIKRFMLMPKSAIAITPESVLYNITSAETPLDTVINGEEAKLFRTFRSWQVLIDANATPKGQYRQITGDMRTFRTWRSSDSTLLAVPADEIENEDLRATFRVTTVPIWKIADPIVLAVDVPVKYFPQATSMSDVRGDTLYSFSSDSGWIRVVSGKQPLHLPLLKVAGNSPSILRCVAADGCVLLTFDVGNEQAVSVVVSPLGVRLSPIIRHDLSTIIAPILESNERLLLALRRTPTSIKRLRIQY